MNRRHKHLLLVFTLLSLWVISALPALGQEDDQEASNYVYLPNLWGGLTHTSAQSPLEQQTDTQVVAAAASTTGATIVSDLADYPPGATVTLTGAGWAAGESVDIFVNDDAGQSWSLRSDPDPVADDAGAFTYSFQLPSWFVANYSVIATGSAGSGTATTAFTDLSIGTYDQCSNDDGDGYASGDTGCQWINGNLQSNNSTYFEGDATVQRVWLTEFAPGTSHTVTFKYGTTKGGKHAYDFLTTWDWSEDWITLADRCQDITGCTTASETTLDIPQDPNVPNTFEPSATGDRQFVMRGGTLTSATTPAIVSGSYTGDSETIITVSFTVANSGPMCPTSGKSAGTCSIAIWFGAHVSAQANWGLGQGAGSISGSPYHVALDAIDGAAIGQRDNQMQAGVVTSIPNGTIVIVKDAVPNDAQDFSFNLTNGTTINQNFSLDDDNDATLPNSQTFSVPPGTWTATELNIPAGWNLTNLVCVDPTSNTAVSGAVATINLASNETVTCTYTNTKEADKLDLTVTKTATPSLTRTYKWGIEKKVDRAEIDIADGGTATFNYTVDVTHDSGTDSAWKVVGAITVNNPNSFSVSGVSVTDAIEANASCTVSGGSSTISANSSATFNYTCTYSAAPAATSQTNTATASWTAFGSPNTSASGTAAVDWSSATVTVKDGSVTVTDPNSPNPPLPASVSYTDASPKSFTYAKTFSGDPAGTCTTHNNTATVTTNDSQTKGTASQSVKVCVGKDLTVSKTAAGTYSREYFWKISKDVDQTLVKIAEGGSYTFKYTVVTEQTGVSDSGWTLAGKITVSNPNDWEAITLSGLSDTVNNGGSCTVDPGPYVIPASGSLVVNYSCSYASAPSSNSGTNTVTATWDKATYFTPSGSANGSASFTLTQAGTNNNTIHVTDSFAGNLGTVTGTDSTPFAKRTFTYDRTESGEAGKCTDYDNTATISETDQSASKKVTLCVGKDLVVEKKAAGTFNRTYKWLIDKSVDDTRIEIGAGGTATFHYTVKVTPDGYTDSGYTLGGTIKVTNPNQWEDIKADITDDLDQGGSCTVTDGTGVTIPAGQSVTLNYSCTTDGTSTKNTATATWDKATYATANDSAAGIAAINFTMGQETNKTITVVDDKTDPANPVTLGTATWGADSTTFTYSLNKKGVAGKCTDYTNIAKISQTGQSDTQTVTVCVAKDLTVEKTAAGTVDRTYKWLIDKSVDDTRIEISDGGIATFHYTVKVTPDGYTESGHTLGGTITVSNPNDWEAITADITDDLDQGGSCTVMDGTGVTILAGQSVTLNYTCTTDGSSTKNTATATWDKATYFTPSGSAFGEAGVNFTIGQETNKTITVVDDKTDPANPVELGTANWADGATTFTYSLDKKGVAGKCTDYTNIAKISETGQSDRQTVTVCVAKDLTVEKTAAGTYDRTYNWLIDKSVDGTRIEISDGGTATFNYTVKVTPDGYTDSGYTLGGTIKVTNPNEWEDIKADVTDVLDQGGSCTVTDGTGVTILAGQSVTLDYTCTTNGSSTKNTAKATWNKVTYFTANDSASGEAAVSFTIGQETNKTITVVDDKTDPANPVTLGTANWVDGAKTFTYALEKRGVAGRCTNYTNIAKISETGQSDNQTVTVCVAKDLTISKTATAAFKRTITWDIAKSVNKTKVNIAEGGEASFDYTVDVTHSSMDSEWVVTGKITVANPNAWEDIVANVSDAVDNGGSCTVTGGSNVIVPKRGQVELDYSCTYPTTGPTDANGTNTASVTWTKATYFTPSGSASGTATFGFTNPTIVGEPGPVTITDSQAGTLGTVAASDPSPTSFTYTKKFQGVAGTCTKYDNTAKITETNQTASQSVTVCVGKNLNVSKTATPTFKRTYNWNISKAVDKTLVKQVGGSVSFNYTVNVYQTGFTDSQWTVKGVITVANPNDWEAISANVSDAVNNGGSCSLDNPAQATVSVSANGSVPIPYTCTFTDGTSGINTATATWDKTAAATPTGTASGTATFAFTTPTTTVNKTITVKDTFNSTTTTLGTVTATDSMPYTTKQFTYSRTITVPANGCMTYNNTAQIVETGQSASQSVKVCGPIKTGALTIGYWQNKNGQGIITSGTSTSGVCNSGTWLRQFAPFQDLSATATCSQVATYVYNIIKAANASGSSMNAMLKAQMLATALDVYFSNPALGGNKINAPAPIGGITIDLTTVCKMIDSNSGTATCSSTSQNVSSAFGGATSLTVMQMLTYAASQSNVGGSTWYGNIKTTQEMAKNAFDAINNQASFAP